MKMAEELFGKIKVEGAQQPPAEQPPVQAPPPESPPIPPPAPPQIPEGEEVLENIEGAGEEEGGEDGALAKLFMDFTSALSSYEDDDLGVIFGRVLQEMIDRQLEVSETTGSVVRRLRRVEAVMAHMLVGGKHKVFVANGCISCECGGLKIALAVPPDDKFVWDSPPKGKQEQGEEEEEESGE
jgi:hypothetical protein